MNCHSVKNALSAYIDLELKPSETIVVKKHLAVCADCENELKLLVATKSGLKSLRSPELSSDSVERIFGGVRAQTVQPKKSGQMVAIMAMAACLSALISVMVISAANGQSAPMVQESRTDFAKNSATDMAESSNLGQMYPVNY